MQPPNDRSSAVVVGSFADLITASGGNQPAPGTNALNPSAAQMPRDFAPAPLSSLTASSDFKAFAEVAKSASLEPKHPEVSEPDLSKASFAPVDTQGEVLSGGK